MSSERSQAEVLWALNEWAKCTTLDGFERSLVDNLTQAASVSLDEFRTKAALYCSAFFGVMFKAMMKAQAQGLCREWPK